MVVTGTFGSALQGAMLFGFSQSPCCCRSRAPPGASSRYTAVVMLALIFLTTPLAAAAAAHRAADPGRRAWCSCCSSRRCSRSTPSPSCSRSARASARATTSASRAASRRHVLGALLALDIPLGIGPLQFNKYFPGGPAQLLSQRLHGGRLARRRRLSGAGAADAWSSGCASCSSARRSSRPRSRSMPAISASRPKASSSTPTTGGTRSCCSA